MEHHVWWLATVRMEQVKIRLHINIAIIYHQIISPLARTAYHLIPFDGIIIEEKITGNFNRFNWNPLLKYSLFSSRLLFKWLLMNVFQWNPLTFSPFFIVFFVCVSRFRYHFQLKPYIPDHKAPGGKDLVYFEPSPGFCVKNPRWGIQGTSGRQCNDTSIGVDGCDLMCCGRGYRTQEVIVVERCSCTFHWCCEVKCKLCRTKKTIHTCL